MQGSASGRNSRGKNGVETRSFAFHLRTRETKPPSYAGWLAADNFCTRQDKKRQCFFGDFHVRITSTSFKK